jgi:hypothetical protein
MINIADCRLQIWWIGDCLRGSSGLRTVRGDRQGEIANPQSAIQSQIGNPNRELAIVNS